MIENQYSAWMIYGAYGHSARMIAAPAKERGLKPILAGRDQAKLTGVAERLGLKICSPRRNLASFMRPAIRPADGLAPILPLDWAAVVR